MGIIHLIALTAWQASFYPVNSIYSMSITTLLPFSTVSQSSIDICFAVFRQDLAEGRRDTCSPGLRGHHHASHTEAIIDIQLTLALSFTFVRHNDSVPVAVMALQEWEHCCWLKLAEQPHKLLAHCRFS